MFIEEDLVITRLGRRGWFIAVPPYNSSELQFGTMPRATSWPVPAAGSVPCRRITPAVPVQLAAISMQRTAKHKPYLRAWRAAFADNVDGIGGSTFWRRVALVVR